MQDMEFSILMCYLEKGLIPVASFSPTGVDSFIDKFKSLTGHEKKHAHRKFRKLFKKAYKARLNEERPWRPPRSMNILESRLEKKYGIGSLDPTKRQRINRRVLVHSYIIRALDLGNDWS